MNTKRIIVGAFILALVPAASLAAGTKTVPAHNAAHAAPAPKVAPADEYFGRMKMSILGITNSIHDNGLREGFDPPNAAKYYTSLALTEDALEDWAHKYPQDSWIPKRAYLLSHDFWLMHTPQADTEAQRCRNILFRQFSHNRYAVLAHKESAATFAPVAAAANVPAKQQQ
jgi:hypothetical protein